MGSPPAAGAWAPSRGNMNSLQVSHARPGLRIYCLVGVVCFVKTTVFLHSNETMLRNNGSAVAEYGKVNLGKNGGDFGQGQ